MEAKKTTKRATSGETAARVKRRLTFTPESTTATTTATTPTTSCATSNEGGASVTPAVKLQTVYSPTSPSMPPPYLPPPYRPVSSNLMTPANLPSLDNATPSPTNAPTTLSIVQQGAPEGAIEDPMLQRELKYPIGGDRFLVFSIFNGNKYVHVRQYILMRGNLFPSKEGIAMSPMRFAAFRQRMADIDEQVENLRAKRYTDAKYHIGGPLFVCLKTEYFAVNLRNFCFPEGKEESVPTKYGIALRVREWEELKNRIPQLLADRPDLAEVSTCSTQDDHMNQMVFFNCCECNHLPCRGS